MLGMGTAIAGGGAALFGMAKNSADAAGRINDMSQKLMMSTTGFQEWDYVLGQNSINIEAMQGGMKKLTNAFDDASAGNERSIESFSRVGLSMDELKGKSPEDMLNMTVAALQGVADPAERAALANDLLGKSGSELAPILNMSGAELEAYKGKAHDLGLVMSGEAITAGDDFGDKMDDVGASFGMVAQKIGVELMPIISTFLDWVLLNMPTIQATMSTVFSVIQTVVTTAVDVFNTYLLPAFRSIFDWVQVNWPTIKATLEAVFNAIKTAVNVAIDVFNLYLLPAFRSIFSWVQANWPAIRETIVSVFNRIKEVWDTVLKPALAAVIAYIRDVLKPKIEEWFPKIKQAVEAAFEAIKTVWDKVLKPAFEAVWGFIRDTLAPAFSTVFDGIKLAVETAFDAVGVAIDVVTGVFEGIKTTIDTVSGWFTGLRDGITNAINAARDAVDLAIQKIKGFFGFEFKWPKLSMPSFGITPDGWKIGDLLKGSIPKLSLKWNAAGGIFDKPTIFDTRAGLQGVGEAGPEAIMPLSKLQQMLDWNNNRNQDRDVLLQILKVMQAIERKDPSMVLDTGVLVGAVKKPINREFGRDAILRERGV